MRKRGELQESLHALPLWRRRKREEWEPRIGRGGGEGVGRNVGGGRAERGQGGVDAGRRIGKGREGKAS